MILDCAFFYASFCDYFSKQIHFLLILIENFFEVISLDSFFDAIHFKPINLIFFS